MTDEEFLRLAKVKSWVVLGAAALCTLSALCACGKEREPKTAWRPPTKRELAALENKPTTIVEHTTATLAKAENEAKAKAAADKKKKEASDAYERYIKWEMLKKGAGMPSIFP